MWRRRHHPRPRANGPDWNENDDEDLFHEIFEDLEDDDTNNELAIDEAVPSFLSKVLEQHRPPPHYGRWLDSLASAISGPPPRQRRSGDQAVIYSITLSKTHPWGCDCEISVGVAKWLKSGRWGAPRPITNPCAPPDSAIEAFTPEDVELARDLVAMTGDGDSYLYSYHHRSINGEAGSGNLFQRIVATGRARLLEGNLFLSVGPALQAHCRWHEGKGGQWSITVTCPQGEALLSRPPCYIDRDKGIIGPLQGLDDAACRALYHAPSVDHSGMLSAHELLRHLITDLEEPPRPPPRDLSQDELSGPQLSGGAFSIVDGQLTINAESWSGAWQCPCAALFPLARYGEHLLPLGEARATSVVDGHTIHRDLVGERRLLHQLQALNLQPVGPNLRFSVGRAQGMDRWAWIDLGDLSPSSRQPRSKLPQLTIDPALRARLHAGGWSSIGDDGALSEASISIVEEWSAEVSADADERWFAVALGIRIGDEKVDALPILRQLAGLDEAAIRNLPRHGDPKAERVVLAMDSERLLAVPLSQVLDLYHALVDLFSRDERQLRLSVWDTISSERLQQVAQSWSGHQRLHSLQQDLRNLANHGFDPVAQPQGLQATLRPYQEDGLRWLCTLRRMGLGGLLADDMGLGKTIQTLAFLQQQWEAGALLQPALVVAPVSTLGNWLRECRRFTPDLRPHIHHGQQRDEQQLHGGNHRLILTSYATLLRDHKLFQDIEWSVVICDEAQALKNPGSQQGQAVRKLATGMRLALTGTPMENHLGELWALMHWIEPGLLGSQAVFDRSFRTPIEKDGDRDRQRALAQRIAPVLLRRNKDAVLDDLPERTDIMHHLELGRHQSALYESIRAAMDDQVRSAIAAKGLSRSKLEFLEALLRLRQVCCHPPLIPTRSAQSCPESAKLDFLRELLPQLVEEGRRILLFSQFTSLLDHIDQLCGECSLARVRLDGRTQNRQAAIDRFQTGDVPLFLISLKAGGIGLNLTAADTVILTDPWWNPAVEQQAIDRAHRIGQRKPVFVHRLIISGSVEERVLELQQHKRELAAGLYDDDGQALATIDNAVVDSLLSPLG